MSRSAKRWMSPTSASSRAAPEGPMPCSSSSVDPRAVTRAVSSFFRLLIFLSMASSSVTSSAASRRRVLPGRSRGRIVASIARACCADRNCLAPPGNSSSSRRCSRLTSGCGRGPARRAGPRACPSRPGHHRPGPGPGPGCAARPSRPSARRPGRSCGHCRWRTPGPARTASAARPARSRRRAPGGARCACRCRCSPRPPRSGPRTSGPRRASARSRPCPCRTCQPQHRGPLIDDLDRRRALVRVHPDDHAHRFLLASPGDVRRGGHCYFELGKPLPGLSSHGARRDRMPCESHTNDTGGQPQ